jgi:Fuc2NAc and GlcNAc transferase
LDAAPSPAFGDPHGSAWIVAAALLAGLIAYLLGRLLIRFASRFGLQDLPNARSSHEVPRPRGGGLGIALAFLLVLPAALPAATFGSWNVWLPLAAATLLALVGLTDDLKGLGLGPRLLAQGLAVAVLLAALAGAGATPESDTGPAAGVFALVSDLATVAPGLADLPPPLLTALDLLLVPLLLLAGLWWINLYNFMDGIDGLAATQGLFMLLAAWAVKVSGPGGSAALDDLIAAPEFAAPLILAGAIAGFLLLNLAPARLFMGDSGSLFIGFAIFAAAAHDVTYGDLTSWTWLILGTSFLVDATVTLLRRWLDGQNVTAAHRSHLYQRLSRRWRSHSRVTLVYFLFNLALVLPLAFFAHHAPQWAPLALLVAWLPAAIVAWRAGAGVKET